MKSNDCALWHLPRRHSNIDKFKSNYILFHSNGLTNRRCMGHCNASDSQMAEWYGASASGTVHLDFIPRWVTTMTLKLVFTASLLDAQHWRDSVENKPASLLVSLGKALSGISLSWVVDRWPATLRRARIALWSLSRDKKDKYATNYKMHSHVSCKLNVETNVKLASRNLIEFSSCNHFRYFSVSYKVQQLFSSNNFMNEYSPLTKINFLWSTIKHGMRTEWKITMNPNFFIKLGQFIDSRLFMTICCHFMMSKMIQTTRRWLHWNIKIIIKMDFYIGSMAGTKGGLASPKRHACPPPQSTSLLFWSQRLLA